MNHKRLITRIGHWMNPFHRNDDEPLLAGMDSPLMVEHDDAAERSQEVRRQGSLTPWGRREESMQRIQQGHEQVLHLVESIQDHLAQQNDRHDRVVDLLCELTRSIKDVPRASNQQAEKMTDLVRQMDISNRHNQMMLGVLNDWPQTATAQKEALDSIAAQVASSTGVTENLSGRLEDLSHAVTAVGQTAKEQVKALGQIQLAARQQEAYTMRMVDTQARRFTMLFAMTIGAAVLAIAASAISLFS